MDPIPPLVGRKFNIEFQRINYSLAYFVTWKYPIWNRLWSRSVADRWTWQLMWIMNANWNTPKQNTHLDCWRRPKFSDKWATSTISWLSRCTAVMFLYSLMNVNLIQFNSMQFNSIEFMNFLVSATVFIIQQQVSTARHHLEIIIMN